jgi:hypothetical protein
VASEDAAKAASQFTNPGARVFGLVKFSPESTQQLNKKAFMTSLGLMRQKLAACRFEGA